MTVVTNTAEGQTSGTAATTVNTGGGSTTAFDAVTTSATCHFDFDAPVFGAAHGVNAYKVTLGGTSGESYVTWSSTLLASNTQTVYARAYVYIDSTPLTSVMLFRWKQGNFSAICGSIRINTSGNLELLDASGTVQGTVSTAIPIDQWVRVEAYCLGNSSFLGSLECRLYTNPEDVNSTDVATVTHINTSGLIQQVRYGHTGTSVANATYWIDDLGGSDEGYLGPSLGSPKAAGTAYQPTISLGGTNVNPTAALATGTANDVTAYARAPINYSDNAVDNTLGLPVAETDLSLYCATAPFGFPSPPFVLRLDQGQINYESMLVTAGSGVFNDPWLVQRAYHSTAAVFHSLGARVSHGIGAADVKDLLGGNVVSSTTGTSILMGTEPPDGTIAANLGTLFLHISTTRRSWHGGPAMTLYQKSYSGANNTGWVVVR